MQSSSSVITLLFCLFHLLLCTQRACLIQDVVLKIDLEEKRREEERKKKAKPPRDSRIRTNLITDIG